MLATLTPPLLPLSPIPTDAIPLQLAARNLQGMSEEARLEAYGFKGCRQYVQQVVAWWHQRVAWWQVPLLIKAGSDIQTSSSSSSPHQRQISHETGK